MIFLVQCAKKCTCKFFQRPQTALALRAREILLVFEKIKLTRAYLLHIAFEIM